MKHIRKIMTGAYAQLAISCAAGAAAGLLFLPSAGVLCTLPFTALLAVLPVLTGLKPWINALIFFASAFLFSFRGDALLLSPSFWGGASLFYSLCVFVIALASGYAVRLLAGRAPKRGAVALKICGAVLLFALSVGINVAVHGTLPQAIEAEDAIRERVDSAYYEDELERTPLYFVPDGRFYAADFSPSGSADKAYMVYGNGVLTDTLPGLAAEYAGAEGRTRLIGILREAFPDDSFSVSAVPRAGADGRVSFSEAAYSAEELRYVVTVNNEHTAKSFSQTVLSYLDAVNAAGFACGDIRFLGGEKHHIYVAIDIKPVSMHAAPGSLLKLYSSVPMPDSSIKALKSMYSASAHA